MKKHKKLRPEAAGQLKVAVRKRKKAKLVDASVKYKHKNHWLAAEQSDEQYDYWEEE